VIEDPDRHGKGEECHEQIKHQHQQLGEPQFRMRGADDIQGVPGSTELVALFA